MPDVWEIANGCNPEVADNNVRHASGYTMLEMYLHDAMMTKYAPVVPTAIQQLPAADKAQKILRDGQIYIQRGAKTYTLQGQVIGAGK